MTMREVGGEEEHILRSKMLDDPLDLTGFERAVEGLHGQPDVPGDHLRRRLLDPGDFYAGTFPILRHSPHQAWKPAHAGFDQDHLQIGKFPEDPFCDQTCNLAREDLGLPDHFFHSE